MAERSRNTLHVTKLDEFDAWMQAQGYLPAETPQDNPWEVRRWINGPKGHAMPIVFKQMRGNKQHYTTNGECTRLVRQWIRERQEQGND